MSSANARVRRTAALEALKAKRNGLNSAVRQNGGSSSGEEDNDLYDEVSEQEYKSILRGRMMDDDFIEDDDGSGYVDDGRNEWERSEGEESGEESETAEDYFERTGRKKAKSKSKSKKQGGKQSDSNSSKSTLVSAFGRQNTVLPKTNGISAGSAARKAADERSASAMEAYRPKVSREKEEDFMQRLMGGLGASDASTAAASSSQSLSMSASSPSARGYPGRSGDYGLGKSIATASRKRPFSSTAFGTSAPSVTYRSAKRQIPSSPSGEGSAPSSDLPEISSDGPDAAVHISGSDTPPWEHRGPDSDQDAAADMTLTLGKAKTQSRSAVASRIDSMDIQDKGRPKALRMQTGGPSDDDDDEDEDDNDFVIQAPASAVSKPLGNKRRMNVSAEAPLTVQETKSRVPPQSIGDGVATLCDAEGQEASAAPTGWQQISASLATAEVTTVGATTGVETGLSAASQVNALHDDGSLSFYWIDHLELDAGVILLIGKVKDRTSGKHVSACLKVQGVERCVFLLMRDRKVDDDGNVTDEQPTEDDIYDEFDELKSKHGIKNFLGKTVTRSYAFELPGVPATGTYLKVKYGFDEPALPSDLQGKTFSHAFGTQTSAMELFLIKRKIMGPCWLRIESPDVVEPSGKVDQKLLSWCKVEYSVDDAKFLTPYSDNVSAASNDSAVDPSKASNGESEEAAAPREVPPLTIASLAMRTVHNHQLNKREIVALSLRTWSDAQLEDIRNPEERPSSVWTAVRPLAGQWPVGFETEIRKQGGKVKAVKWERALLNGLLAQFQLLDPDIILTHDFASTDLDVLLSRMRELRVDHWSRLGRFRRQGWPKLRNGWNLGLMRGRLCCDLGSDVGKSMISSTTWSLTEMVGSHLKVQREDIDPDDVPSYFDSAAPNPSQLLTFLQHCEVDTFFLMSLAHKVQILPLTKQLTNLAGNTWARTLSGGRAERNEYILLHDFHRRKFIVPDKLSGGKRAAAAKAAAAAEAEAEDGAEAKSSGSKKSKKDKYKGGLVFDPKRGLWDRYILVMDFNSLYPSIIQEYNIDFTTVDRTRFNAVVDPSASEGREDDAVEDVPDIPSSDVSQGVLPTLIAKLVERRRQVKSLMKDKRAPAHKQLQWNVKQLALKLTANSMYGCLGFEGSRFYARPLAALTTFKGREILTSTKELAESLDLDVIYGDTDSVMINTNATTYAQAAKIGNDFKRAVNERYKLLEIDTDAVFERMLLLQKKKYAARKVEEVEILASGEERKKVTTEIKGLDMKRREYSALSKNVSSYVLEQILSGDSTEDVITAIHNYLGEISDAVRQGQIPLEDYIIFKRLGKDPKAYGSNLAGQPHVHVALRMQERGLSARMGDVIPYIFCLGQDGSSSSKSAQADRAHHPDELRKQDCELKVDYEHYLALQILPPVERLCESIEGTDRARLAECLGLDASRYASSTLATVTSIDREFLTLDSQTPDEVRFAKCERLLITCNECQEQCTFEGLLQATSTSPNEGVIQTQGLLCSSSSCRGQGLATSLATNSVAIQLELSIRRQISRYYSGWQICSEPSCGVRTRMIGVYASRCLVKDCRGRMSPEYSDKQLYDQLCYYASLFDADGALEKVQSKSSSGSDVKYNEVKVLADHNRGALDVLAGVAQRYLDRNDRRYVDLGKIFGRGRRL
ncbi:unnamed protein product [Parajaminaea phylloscopi]